MNLLFFNLNDKKFKLSAFLLLYIWVNDRNNNNNKWALNLTENNCPNAQFIRL